MEIKLLSFRIKSWMRHQFRARHRKGYGIHSPFVFYFVREVMYERYPFYGFATIQAVREMLQRSRQKINIKSIGAPSVYPAKEKTIRQLVKEGSMPAKYGELLFRIIVWQSCQNIVELGTGTGIGSLYLSLPDSRSKVTTIEGNEELCHVASHVFENAGVSNVRVLNGKIDEVLPGFLKESGDVDFVLFDGDHQYEKTLQYFEMCLARCHNNTVLVFDDIHWSPEMEKAWIEIVNHPEVSVSIDLFRMGIVFLKKECTRQHYLVRY